MIKILNWKESERWKNLHPALVHMKLFPDKYLHYCSPDVLAAYLQHNNAAELFYVSLPINTALALKITDPDRIPNLTKSILALQNEPWVIRTAFKLLFEYRFKKLIKNPTGGL
jgi:hypothetical protein